MKGYAKLRNDFVRKKELLVIEYQRRDIIQSQAFSRAWRTNMRKRKGRRKHNTKPTIEGTSRIREVWFWNGVSWNINYVMQRERYRIILSGISVDSWFIQRLAEGRRVGYRR